MQDINNGVVEFTHNGGITAPSYTLSLLIGSTQSGSKSATITFYVSPAVKINQITIKQNHTITLTTSNILGVDTGLLLTYQISNLTNGKFQLSSAIGQSITSFTHSQLTNGLVQFVHDGTTNAPCYGIDVFDGTDTSTILMVTITSFIPLPIITMNTFTLKQSKNVTIASSMINAVGGTGLTITFTVSNLVSVSFKNKATGLVVNSFTVSDIASLNIIAIDDGTLNQPSFDLIANDGTDSTVISHSSITFVTLPTFTLNQLSIKQNKTVLIETTMIFGTVGYGLTLNLIVSNLLYGTFQLTSSNFTVTSFTLNQITNSQIQFVQDGSTNAPNYQVQGYDGQDYTVVLQATVSFILLPAFTYNQVVIRQGASVLITSNMIFASMYTTSNIIFNVAATSYCFFEVLSNPNVALSQFTTNQITANMIYLIQDGSINIPSYTLTISDGDDSTSSSGKVTFIRKPILDKSELTIKQGERLILTTNMINGTTFNSQSPKYVVGLIYHATLQTINNAISDYTQAQIESGIIAFTHDGTLSAPILQISVSDGAAISNAQTITITFLPNIVLTNNTLRISKGGVVIMTSDSLSANNSVNDSSKLVFQISNLIHGVFVQTADPSKMVLSFTQKQITFGQITFMHDNSDYPPSYFVSVGDGAVNTDPQAAIIKYGSITTPMFLKNILIINQGDSVVLTSNNLVFYDETSNDLLVQVVSVLYGRIENIANIGTAITAFHKSELNSNQIQFVHDNSLNYPQYSLIVKNTYNFLSSDINIATIYFNIKPVILTNSMNLLKGQKVKITSSILSANDVDGNQYSLTFYIYNGQHGSFENNLGLNLDSFSQQDIINGLIYFAHDGSTSSPSYQVMVSDGKASTIPSAAKLDFIITKGIGELKKIVEINTEFMLGIGSTSDNNYLVAALFNGKVMIINVYDGKSAYAVTDIDLSIFGVNNLNKLIIFNNLVYISSNDQGLVVVSISNITQPLYLGKLGLATIVNDFIIYNNYTYLISGNNNLYVISLQNSTSPVVVNVLNLGASLAAIGLIENFLVIICNDNSMKMYLIDISSPLNPVLNNTIILNMVGTSMNCLLISNDGSTLFVGTQSGLSVFDITNIDSPNIVYKIALLPIYSMSLSSDGAYIAAVCDQQIVLINIQILQQPIVLQKVAYSFGLNQMIFSDDGFYLYVSSGEGLQIIEVFKGYQSRLNPTIDLINSTDLNGSPDHIALTSDGVFAFVNSPNLAIIKNNQILKSINLNSEPIMTAINQDDSFAYVTTQNSVLKIINIINPFSPYIVNSTKIPGCWGIILSSTGDYAYITTNQPSGLIILSINSPTNPCIVKNLTGLNGTPKMLTLSNDNDLLYVSCEGYGLTIINVTVKSNATILSQTKFGDPRSLVFISQNNVNYIIMSYYLEGSIKVINVNDATSPFIVVVRYVGRKIGGISLLLSNNYAIIQSNAQLSVLEIRNLSNPVIVDQFSLATIEFTYQIAVTQYSAYMPNFQSYALYSESIYFYGLVSSVTDQGKKTFVIDLIPLNPYSLDKSQTLFSLINVASSDADLPYWIQTNLASLTLSVVPPSAENLKILRTLTLTYATQIQFIEFSGISTNKTSMDIYNALLYIGYIDANRIPTNQYQSDSTLPIDSSFNLTSIQNVIDKHCFTHKVNFILDDFFELDKEPYVNFTNIQKQFDKYSKIKINQQFEFEFMDDTFIDPDGDDITYSVENLPNWITFNGRKFVGTSTKDNIGSYRIKVIASDSYKNCTDYLTLSVYKKPPIAISVLDQNLNLGESFNFVIPSENFIDSDGFSLSYKVSMIENNQSRFLPSWLNFDITSLRLYGTPAINDIERVSDGFNQTFIINVSAIDIVDQIASILFNLRVINKCPLVNSIDLDTQFKMIYPSYLKIGIDINFDIYSDTFQDPQGYPLTYSVSGLPDFLQFSAGRFYGSPTKNDIGVFNIKVIASNGYSNTSNSFEISVQNHAPYLAENITNQTFILGKSFLFYIPENTIMDPDNDTLIYSAFLLLNSQTSYVNNILNKTIKNETNNENSTNNESQSQTIINSTDDNNQLNNDNLNTIYYNKVNGNYTLLPGWLNFDSARLLFTGSPTIDDIAYESKKKKYYQEFQILIVAYDVADINATCNFTLIIQNVAPQKNLKKSLQSQFKSIAVQPQIDTETQFRLDSTTFIDENNVSLTLTARLSNSRSRLLVNLSNDTSTTLLPDWIKFDTQLQQFLITPPSGTVLQEYKVEVTAFNGIQSVSDQFSFTVQYSMSYLLTYITQIVSGILGVIGLIKFQPEIYGFIFKRYYRYNHYQLIPKNQPFSLQFFLINEDLETAYFIWEKIQAKYKGKKKNWTQSYFSTTFLYENIKDIIKSQKRFDSYEINKGSIIYDIIESFLLYKVISEHPFAQKMFKKLKSSLENKYMKAWYMDLVIIEYQEDWENGKKFPKIVIKQENLDNFLREKSNNNKGVFDEKTVMLQRNLIESLIKVNVLGIPSHPLYFYEFLESSRGLSLFINSENISEIQMVNENTLDCCLFKCLFKHLPTKKNYSSLANVIDYKIQNNVINFFGESSTIGRYVIRIFNSNGFILREFFIEFYDSGIMKESAKKIKISTIKSNNFKMNETATSLIHHSIENSFPQSPLWWSKQSKDEACSAGKKIVKSCSICIPEIEGGTNEMIGSKENIEVDIKEINKNKKNENNEDKILQSIKFEKKKFRTSG